MKELRHAFLGLALTLLAACENRAPWPNSGVFVGYYARGWEKSDFKPVGTRERWWLTGNIGAVTNRFGSPSTVYLVVRGTLSAEGRHGHLGYYKRELLVHEVIEVRALGPDEVAGF